MNKTNIRIFQRINKKYRLYIFGLISILFIVSAFFFYKAMTQPITIEENIVKNTIEEKVTFDYKALVKPSILYPEGGKVVPDGVIFSQLTDALIIHLNATIDTDEPVKIEGSKEVVLKIIAKDMWEREAKLLPFQSINQEGINHTILKEEISINLEEILMFIKTVEEEALVRPNNYSLLIKPEIKGTVFDKNGEKIHELTSELEIPFEVSSQYIRYAAEIGASTEVDTKQYVNTTTIEENNIIQQYFNLFGWELSVVKSRLWFGIITFTLLLIMLIGIVEITITKKKKVLELDLIEKKYKNKIVNVTDKSRFENLMYVNVDNFKSLLKISEEKEELILKYINDIEGMVYYYVMGTTYVYSYHTPMEYHMESSEFAYDK